VNFPRRKPRHLTYGRAIVRARTTMPLARGVAPARHDPPETRQPGCQRRRRSHSPCCSRPAMSAAIPYRLWCCWRFTAKVGACRHYPVFDIALDVSFQGMGLRTCIPHFKSPRCRTSRLAPSVQLASSAWQPKVQNTNQPPRTNPGQPVEAPQLADHSPPFFWHLAPLPPLRPSRLRQTREQPDHH
jgi:hypothetical protein